MPTQSTKENVLDTLKDSILIGHIDIEDLDAIAQNIVVNLGIEYDTATKWE